MTSVDPSCDAHIYEIEDPDVGYAAVFDGAVGVFESAGTHSVIIERRRTFSGELRVAYETKDLTASAGVQYVATSGELVFADGETTKTISVPIINDDEFTGVQTPKTFAIRLVGDNIGDATEQTVFVFNDDFLSGTPEFSNLPTVVDEGVRRIIVDLARVGGSESDLSFFVSTIDGTAVNGRDYQGYSSLPIVLRNGETVARFALNIIDNQKFDGDRTFQVVLSDGDLPTPIAATITIVNDDPNRGTLAFSTSESSVEEDSGTTTILVSRFGASEGQVSVSYTTLDGSARASEHYRQTGGKLILEDGETSASIVLELIDNEQQDPQREFRVQLVGQLVSDPDVHTVRIFDNEAASAASTFGAVNDQVATSSKREGTSGGGSIGLMTFLFLLIGLWLRKASVRRACISQPAFLAPLIALGAALSSSPVYAVSTDSQVIEIDVREFITSELVLSPLGGPATQHVVTASPFQIRGRKFSRANAELVAVRTTVKVIYSGQGACSRLPDPFTEDTSPDPAATVGCQISFLSSNDSDFGFLKWESNQFGGETSQGTTFPFCTFFSVPVCFDFFNFNRNSLVATVSGEAVGRTRSVTNKGWVLDQYRYFGPEDSRFFEIEAYFGFDLIVDAWWYRPNKFDTARNVPSEINFDEFRVVVEIEYDWESVAFTGVVESLVTPELSCVDMYQRRTGSVQMNSFGGATLSAKVLNGLSTDIFAEDELTISLGDARLYDPILTQTSCASAGIEVSPFGWNPEIQVRYNSACGWQQAPISTGRFRPATFRDDGPATVALPALTEDDTQCQVSYNWYWIDEHSYTDALVSVGLSALGNVIKLGKATWVQFTESEISRFASASSIVGILPRHVYAFEFGLRHDIDYRWIDESNLPVLGESSSAADMTVVASAQQVLRLSYSQILATEASLASSISLGSAASGFGIPIALATGVGSIALWKKSADMWKRSRAPWDFTSESANARLAYAAQKRSTKNGRLLIGDLRPSLPDIEQIENRQIRLFVENMLDFHAYSQAFDLSMDSFAKAQFDQADDLAARYAGDALAFQNEAADALLEIAELGGFEVFNDLPRASGAEIREELENGFPGVWRSTIAPQFGLSDSDLEEIRLAMLDGTTAEDFDGIEPRMIGGDFFRAIAQELILLNTEIFADIEPIPATYVVIPDFVGAQDSFALKTLGDLQLELGGLIQVASRTVPAGQVVEQSREAGGLVMLGSFVSLTVSSGLPIAEVPSLLGLTESEAQAALSAGNFAVGSGSRANSDSVPAGQVISQDPAAGTRTVEQTAVSYIVSDGPASGSGGGSGGSGSGGGGSGGSGSTGGSSGGGGGAFYIPGFVLVLLLVLGRAYSSLRQRRR
ncbi:MAG: Calx-beta domain-containing protein, partial [Pseudomonadota bacterium]